MRALPTVLAGLLALTAQFGSGAFANSDLPNSASSPVEKPGPAVVAATARKGPMVGIIIACYYSKVCSYPQVVSSNFTGVVDGPAFLFVNLTAAPITNAYFKILGNKTDSPPVLADKFAIGTIPAFGQFVIVPGASNDGNLNRSSSSLFYYRGANQADDTSDNGPNANNIEFSFGGSVSGSVFGQLSSVTVTVTSPIIVTGATAQPSADNSVSSINFLGGPGNADAPCNDCFPPTVIAKIYAPATDY